jgi:hypothetical protein
VRTLLVEGQPVLAQGITNRAKKFGILIDHAGAIPDAIGKPQDHSCKFAFAVGVSPTAAGARRLPLTALVSRLRARLSKSSAGDAIHTARGVGFMLSDIVTRTRT